MKPKSNPTNNTKKPFHSNGYAQIASGDRIGAVSSASFSQRQAIESSRRIIGQYKHSRLGIAHGSLKAKPQDAVDIKNPDTSKKTSLQEFNSNSKSTNPKPQNYNPYS